MDFPLSLALLLLFRTAGQLATGEWLLPLDGIPLLQALKTFRTEKSQSSQASKRNAFLAFKPKPKLLLSFMIYSLKQMQATRNHP